MHVQRIYRGAQQSRETVMRQRRMFWPQLLPGTSKRAKTKSMLHSGKGSHFTSFDVGEIMA